MSNLAIVIPYYKIDFFEETLKSIALQTDKRFSLYIGNDASSNDPMSIILKYFPNGGYKYFNYEENLGGKNLAMQWERILLNVTEEWFQILGDDDIISENFVEEFYKVEKELSEEINLIRVKNIYFNDRFKVYREGLDYPVISNSLKLFEDKLHHRTLSTLSENIFRKKMFDLKGFKLYPIAWHTDDMLILEVTEFENFYYNSKANVKIYNGSINLSSSKKNIIEKFRSSQQFFEDLLFYYSGFLKKSLINVFIKKLYVEARENLLLIDNKLIYILLKKGYLKEAYRVFKMNKFLKNKWR